MTGPSEFEILSLKEEEGRFIEYIEDTANQRIIFSGIFGAGKTTFLKKAFENNPDFVALHLFPSDYSVTATEDIFKLIKYDLLYEILCSDPILEDSKCSYLEAVAFLTKVEQNQIIKSLFELIPHFNKSIKSLTKPLGEIIKIINKRKTEMEKDEVDVIVQFIKEMEAENIIYERDAYTKLITGLIERLKEKGKMIVLVIDDLDRIDPEHIFRILNVFAVHFDVSNINPSPRHPNKFNLDKVILCCDIENIRNIFKHRYGMYTDFNGYIDKFYSTGIFFFDIKSKLFSQVGKIIKSISFSEEAGQISFLKDPSNTYFKNLEILLASMILSNKLSTRDLYRSHRSNYKVPVYNLKTIRGEGYQNWQFSSIMIFDFLKEKFGGFTKVREMLNDCYITDPVQPKILKRLEADLCLIIEFKNNIDLNTSEFRPSWASSRGIPATIKINRSRAGMYETYFCSYVEEDIFRRDVFQDILIKAFDAYRDMHESNLRIGWQAI